MSVLVSISFLASVSNSVSVSSSVSALISSGVLLSVASKRAIGFSFGETGDGGGVNGFGGVSVSLFMLVFSLRELFDVY